MVTKKLLLRSFLLGTFCCFSVTAIFAQDTPAYGSWGFDSIKPSTGQTAPDSDPSDYQQIYSLLVTMADRWNAHDLDGYLSVYWKSPDLLLVVEGEQLKGWADMVASYHRGYTNLDEMGSFTPDRIQIQMVTPGVAIALDWWTAYVRRRKILGTSTLVLRKFDEGWKIVVGHTSFVEP
jgi:beta-aspartyl-peptidase (threonine type)